MLCIKYNLFNVYILKHSKYILCY